METPITKIITGTSKGVENQINNHKKTHSVIVQGFSTAIAINGSSYIVEVSAIVELLELPNV